MLQTAEIATDRDPALYRRTSDATEMEVKHADTEPSPPQPPSRAGTGAPRVRGGRFGPGSEAIHGRSCLRRLGFHVAPEAAAARFDVHQSAVVPGGQRPGRAPDQRHRPRRGNGWRP